MKCWVKVWRDATQSYWKQKLNNKIPERKWIFTRKTVNVVSICVLICMRIYAYENVEKKERRSQEKGKNIEPHESVSIIECKRFKWEKKGKQREKK